MALSGSQVKVDECATIALQFLSKNRRYPRIFENRVVYGNSEFALPTKPIYVWIKSRFALIA
jgi:hypothetical protein